MPSKKVTRRNKTTTKKGNRKKIKKNCQGSEISCIPANTSAGKTLPSPHRNNHPDSGGDNDDDGDGGGDGGTEGDECHLFSDHI